MALSTPVSLNGTGTATSGTSDHVTSAAASASAAIGDLVILIGSVSGTNVLYDAASDSAGNTYTRIFATANGTAATNLAFFVGGTLTNCAITHAITSGSTTFTMTHTATGSFFGTRELAVLKSTGTATIANDQSLGTANTTASTTATGGNVTTTVANELLIGAVSSPSNVTATAGNSFTELFDFVSGTTQSLEVAYRSVTSTGTYNYVATLSGSQRNVVGIATFYDGGGGTAVLRQTQPQVISHAVIQSYNR